MDENRSTKLRKLLKSNINRKVIYDRVREAEGVTKRHAHRFVLKRLDSVREAKRHIVMWIILVGLLIGATGLQLIWNQQGYKANEFVSGGVYAEAALGPVDSLNPLFASSKAEESLSRLIFSSLFRYDTKGQLGNDLAKDLKISENGTLYTVKLRTDALWHDGFRVTANDIVFTVNLLKDPNLRSTNPEDWTGITVKAIDDETVAFKLPNVIASFAHALTFPILPKHVLYTVEPNVIRENDFSSNPVGSGVFKFKLLQDIGEVSGHKVVYLDSNEDYYGGVSKLERFQLHAYGSQDYMVKALTSGEVNAVADLSQVYAESIDSNKYSVESAPIKSGVYALLNTTRGAMADKKVRQALRAGTDTQAIRSQALGDRPELYLPFIEDQLSGSVPSAPKYNVKTANALLDQAGWKRGTDGIRKKDKSILQFTVVATKDSNYEKTLESIVGQWRALGIKIDTMVLDLDGTSQREAQEIIQSREYDAMLYQLTLGADLDVYAYWHSSQAKFGGLNLSNYSNEIADDALSSARSRLESNLRNAKYLTFARQWLEDIPAIGLYQSTMYYAHSKKDKAYDENNVLVSALDRYADVEYWAVNIASVYKTP